MTILHSCWHASHLHIWGEVEACASGLPDGPRSAVAVSPFDAGAERLCHLLRPLMPGTGETPQPATLELFLPSRAWGSGFRPVPSQPFFNNAVFDGAGEEDAPDFPHPWRVTAVVLPWRATLVLLGLVREPRLADELFIGESLLGFATLFRFAGALVARGRFLPALHRTSEKVYEARWIPALDAADRKRLERLAPRLPPAAFAAGNGSPREALEELVDRLVRASVVTTLSRAHAERGPWYSPHDAWFAALRGETRQVRWKTQAELEALAGALRQWRQPVESGEPGKVPRFTLEVPDGPEGAWFLRVLAEEGPEGEVPPPAWDAAFLLSLGQASLLFPPLARAETRGGKFGCALSEEEAHAFLTVAAAVLEAAGYAVNLPPQWRPGHASALALEADLTPLTGEDPTTGTLSEARVAVTWSVTFNGTPLTKEEAVQLERAETPLVSLRGQWQTLDLKRVREALRAQQRTDTVPVRQAVRLALGTEPGAGGLEIARARGRGWLDPLLDGLAGGMSGMESLPVPTGFRGVLRPYQLRGFRWLAFLRAWGFGACLADDMGLGKTVQALAFLLHEKDRGERRPVLLAGPMTVLGSWLNEARRFAPELRLLLHHGPGRAKGEDLARAAMDADVVVTSYALLHRDYAALRRIGWSGIVLDEAQNIKNPDTRQARAARALQADYRIALTGTPMENHVGELWSVMDFLNPGLLGRRAVFRETFFRPIQAGTDPGARARLRRVTAPFILRRLKTDRRVIADLPAKIEAKVFCPLTREQAELYEEVLESFRRDAEASEGIERRGLILAVLTRLKQVCNHPAHFLGQSENLARRSGKLERLVERLEEVFARGESALVFTQYAVMGKLLAHHLCRTFARETPFLHGGLTRPERDRMIRAFQNGTRPQAFVLSLKAGGTGLNLTRANHVFHFDRWWNPAVENQATDRVFRIGQAREVMVHTLLCNGTLEERIDALIADKTGLANEVVVSGEEFLTGLPDDALLEVLKLDAEVVDEEDAAPEQGGWGGWA
ncbi:MAG TPA: DEAD/DEAH box helicase [Kiritimatiellia bacterium]|mgnify:CR=1 FL=1|nr:DEAD/DEAH box helicase [Kiritimatiellia bacterium]HOM58362.1 DEAD/DEAH box helicase [Kiritimatiellia bacterium]HOR97407.1 DEAD/DEAH box helicase [Kiritimatiellia bacterium]HPC48504.1 DEAD/DEAH box helicase [Kiritimatiellia bacterium]HPK37068.1 DEAD/DEAH box helicase [Kiritimatiellia bacterium]